ncbi:PAS domain S-box-containing protein/diguanylate cyclase (GGDEF) domain-containing protein [Noviherbaspirillum humi]|uniref:PAS domain S-box-containing protein/diguanylate cyclase (GGDEF) domain-containing protein n=1 Tax=Noviherbaspirillum humi TaxID=1688639 RepID=A0A239M4F6_9BURK|nr:EAL domain-containing protein [Noviherbaspirillum humi]SNT37717.1 PAS domain S-box-containing protein/diguanylate cyclase (GGDEF) domain-containing protein [Noviherbaspirillum humi]
MEKPWFKPSLLRHSGPLRLERLRFLQAHLHLVLAWPTVGLILGMLMWGVIQSRVEKEWETAREQARRQTLSAARAYARQTSHAVERIDQALLMLKHEAESAPSMPQSTRLEPWRHKGFIPESPMLRFVLLNRDGGLIASSAPGADSGMAAADDLVILKQAAPDALHIAIAGNASPGVETAVRFSRRLENGAGEFNGVVSITAEPAFLTAFYDDALAGSDDLLAVQKENGPLLASRLGARQGLTSTFFLEPPAFDASTGIRQQPGTAFRDGQARIIAWQKLEKYPLVVLSARSEEEAYTSYYKAAQAYHGMGIAGSLLLLAFSLVGMAFAIRLAWREQQDEAVKNIFRLAVDGAREGFFMIRPVYGRNGHPSDYQIEDCNERGASMVGHAKRDLIGKYFSTLYSGEFLQKMNAFFQRGLESGFHEEEVRLSPESRMSATWMHRRVVRSGAGLAMTVRDVSDIKAHEQALSNMANADTLTALPNRHWLMNFLPLALEQARSADAGVALLFIDLDDFKNINDTLGHLAGDELLKGAAQRLKSLVRASDHVVRLGGDEFTIVLQQVGRIEDVTRLARLIVQAMNEPFTLARSSGHRVHASIGISMFPQDGADGDTLLKHADMAMYAAKAAGKGQFHFYQSHLSDRLILRVNKEQALRQAIERDEFVLHYQPRVDTLSGKLSSMEALVRWMHPEHGLLPPLEFIQVAEDTGLITKLGEMVIEKACAQIGQWQAQGLPVVPVSINVSALQLNNGSVERMLADCMARHGIDASLIGIELTESSMFSDAGMVSGELDAVRSLGVKLLVDDFGTGYSSLSQLQQLDVDVLKVDRAFTHRLCEGSEGKALFKAIVSMADALDLRIVAEGVETAEQLDALQSLGCDEVQGYLVSHAVPAADMPGLMQKRFLFPPSFDLSEAAA